MAHNAKIYALKITAGDAEAALVGDIIDAWDWCITHKNNDPCNPIMIISHSFGGGRYFSPEEAETDNLAEFAAATRVAEAGITLLASAGNDGWCDSMGAPAAFSNVISVGAVYDAAVGNFSWCVDEESCATTYGTGDCATGFAADDTAAADRFTVYSDTAYFLDVLAPSNNAYTTDIVGSAGYSINDYDIQFGGTSAACPYAAGAVACIQSAAKAEFGQYLTPQQIRGLLISTGHPVTDTKVDITKPRVDLAAAIGGINASGIHVEDGCMLNGRIIYNWNPAGFTWAPDDHNIEENPRFVGDYYLSQTIVAGQTVQSPCVDAGSDHASSICFDGVCLGGYTTRTDNGLDTGTVDMGYHHSLARKGAGVLAPCSYCDLAPPHNDPDRPGYPYGDGTVNIEDFASLALSWLDFCTSQPWCSEEFTSDYYVGFDDLAFFAGCWLRHDQGPEPDPSTWETVPRADTPTSITMTATTAFDRWGWRVQYYFEETSSNNGGTNSGWQLDPVYRDDGLTSGKTYTYRVRTRDTSPYGNVSGWSEPESATPIIDTMPPYPVNWSLPPNATGATTIMMIAQTATDDEGYDVEYFFEETSDTPGGDDSGWQGGVNYSDTGLTPGTQYCYRMKVRDTSPNWNESSWSSPNACAITGQQGGNLPPHPVGFPGAGAQWESSPREVVINSKYYHLMVAISAVDPEPNPTGVEYYFTCTSGQVADSGWQDPVEMGGDDYARQYITVEVPPGSHYCYTVKYRDKETPPAESVATDPPVCVQP